MPKDNHRKTGVRRMYAIAEFIGTELPHLASFLADEEDFLELRFKLRDDSTTLAIAKGFDGSGGPVVCFAQGYGVIGALMAIDAAIQGNNWREDKPWRPES